MELPGSIVVQAFVAQVKDKIRLVLLRSKLVDQRVVVIDIGKSVAGNGRERLLEFGNRVEVVGVEAATKNIIAGFIEAWSVPLPSVRVPPIFPPRKPVMFVMTPPAL